LQISCSKTLLVLVSLLLVIIAVGPLPVGASQADAATVISSAKDTILDCYDATKDAEAAGANITAIVGTLNEASSFLSQAEFAYTTNDFDVAINLARQSQNILINYISEANILKETATQQQNQDFQINVILSTIGTFAVVAAGLAVWFFTKKKYKNGEV